MRLKYLVVPAFAALLTACGSDDHQSHVVHQTGPLYYVASLHATEGNEDVHGYVTFQPTAGGVDVLAHVEGLEPGQRHGFHIHEYGDCSAADGTSAGGHFNPHGSRHGAPHEGERHSGDLGNLSADHTGMAHLEEVYTHFEMSGPDSILGRAVIVHAAADDLESQPTGDAGARVACGVIGVGQSGAHSGH